MLFSGCTVERAQEQVLAEHANGAKKTSIWVYPDGEILKRNEWYTDGIKELEIPYKDRDDIVWRGQLTRNLMQPLFDNGVMTRRFGDVEITFGLE